MKKRVTVCLVIVSLLSVLIYWGSRAGKDFLQEQEFKTALLDQDYPRFKDALDKGVDPNLVIRRHSTAVHRKWDVFRLFDNYDSPALLIAASYSDSRFVAALLQSGARVDPPTPSGSGVTPLMHAALEGNTRSVKLLLDAGANANAFTEDGFNPLFYAYMRGKSVVKDRRGDDVYPIMELLVQAGADDTIDRGKRFAALDRLKCEPRSAENARLIKLLQSAHRPPNLLTRNVYGVQR